MKAILFLFLFTATLSAKEEYVMIVGKTSSNYLYCSIPALIDTKKYSDEILKEYFIFLWGISSTSEIKIYKANSINEVKRMGDYGKYRRKVQISKTKLRKYVSSKKL